MGNQNYCVFRTEKLKSHKDVVNVLKEQQRSEDYESKRADKSLSKNNTYSADYVTTQKKYDELLPKKYRRDAVVGLMFVVTTSNEFENLEDEKKYYEKAVEFIQKNFGEVVGWAIHRDETSTHLQAVTIPLVDGKLNAKKLIGGSKHRMQEIQQKFFEEVGKPFGLERGKKNSQAQHKTVEELHKEEERKLWDAAHRIEKLQKNLEEREKIMVEEIQKKAEKIAPGVAVENVHQTLSEALQTFEKAISIKEHQLSEKVSQNKAESEKINEWQKLAPQESLELIRESDEIADAKISKPINFRDYAGRVRKALSGAWETVKRWKNKALKLEKELEEKRSALDDWRRRSPKELEDMARTLKLKNCRNSYELIEKEKACATLQNEIDKEHRYSGRS